MLINGGELEIRVIDPSKIKFSFELEGLDRREAIIASIVSDRRRKYCNYLNGKDVVNKRRHTRTISVSAFIALCGNMRYLIEENKCYIYLDDESADECLHCIKYTIMACNKIIEVAKAVTDEAVDEYMMYNGFIPQFGSIVTIDDIKAYIIGSLKAISEIEPIHVTF